MKKTILFFIITCGTLVSYGQSENTGTDTVLLPQDTTESIVAKIDTLRKQLSTFPEEAVERITDINPPSISDLISLSKIFWAIIFIVIGYFSIKLISKALEIFAERSTTYRITIKSFIPVIKILGWLLLIFTVIAAVFKPPAATLLAFSASVGVAIGFASQDILKNIFGGIMILFDRPFKSGDKIEVGNYYGEVVEIGLRSTRITTPDDNLVSIPNSEIMNKAVSNANAGEANCQVVAEIYLPIDADTIMARKVATEAAQVSKYIYLNKPIVIIFTNEFKEKQSILKMKVKAYVLDIRDEFKFKSEMTETTIKNLVELRLIHPNTNNG